VNTSVGTGAGIKTYTYINELAFPNCLGLHGVK
jgi:hypothetical protein